MANYGSVQGALGSTSKHNSMGQGKGGCEWEKVKAENPASLSLRDARVGRSSTQGAGVKTELAVWKICAFMPTWTGRPDTASVQVIRLTMLLSSFGNAAWTSFDDSSSQQREKRAATVAHGRFGQDADSGMHDALTACCAVARGKSNKREEIEHAGSKKQRNSRETTTVAQEVERGGVRAEGHGEQ